MRQIAFGMPRCLFLIGAALALTASPAAAAPATVAANPLDQRRIHADYNDGNFEKVVSALEGFMAARKTYSFQDSVFIAKHLAVVYTASPDTREKGKYYMYRLLFLLPSAKLIDMYVSDEIDRIFDKVREEFITRQRNFGADTARVAVPEKAPAGGRGKAPVPAERPPVAGPAGPKESHAGMWIAGGAAVAAAGLAMTYFFLQGDQPSANDRTYHVPKN